MVCGPVRAGRTPSWRQQRSPVQGSRMVHSPALRYVKDILRPVKRALFPTAVETYPVSLSLKLDERTLYFQAHNRTERFRVEGCGQEPEMLASFVQAIEPSDTIFDIGASVGLMTVHAAAVAERGEVFAFEPDPENMLRLRHNVVLNGLKNVTFLQWAVSNTAGTCTLYTDGSAGAAPTLREQTNRTIAPKGQIQVPTKTIDDEIRQKCLPAPDLIKMDIEGAEILALSGAQSLLAGRFRRRPRVIFLELHPLFLPDFGATVQDVQAIMLAHGYKLAQSNVRADQIHEIYRWPGSN